MTWKWAGVFAATSVTVIVLAVLATPAAGAGCPQVRLEYRVWLKQGVEYVDVENPRIDGTDLVWRQYGGEVRQAADNLIKIEPLSPETAEQVRAAHVWNLRRLQTTLVQDTAALRDAFRTRQGFAPSLHQAYVDIHAARAYMESCRP